MMRLREGLQLHPLWGPHRHARWPVLLHRLRGQRRGAHDRMLQLVGSRWSLRLWAPQLRAGSASESGFGCIKYFVPCRCGKAAAPAAVAPEAEEHPESSDEGGHAKTCVADRKPLLQYQLPPPPGLDDLRLINQKPLDPDAQAALLRDVKAMLQDSRIRIQLLVTCCAIL